jgi:hypothetical protein
LSSSFPRFIASETSPAAAALSTQAVRQVILSVNGALGINKLADLTTHR